MALDAEEKPIDRLLSAAFWDDPLARFAKATGLVISLYDLELRRYSGPHLMSPLAQCFGNRGFWNEEGLGTHLEKEAAIQCFATSDLFNTAALGALGLCAMPAILQGKVIGALVVGWVPDQFIDPVVSNRIAKAADLQEMDVWQVLRMQAPMTSEKLLLYMEMLQTFTDALFKQLEIKEHDIEQARDLRVIAASAIELSAATSPKEISIGLARAVERLIPGADVAISISGGNGALELLMEHKSPFAADPQIVTEHSLKVPIKSASQNLLGAIDIRLPPRQSTLDLSSELSTLAAQAAVALQKAKLIQDLAQERNALNKANGELRNLHRMKDEFLANVSHELRTPLNSILGWSQILKEDLLPPGEFKDATSAIERNARIQARLIEDLLDVSRIISGKMILEREVIKLNEILKRSIETINPAAESKLQDILVSLPEDVVSLRGDSTRLQQVFWNLLANAVKFTPNGGQIAVFAEKIGGYVTVAIKDNGKGIPKDFLPHLFDRFSQVDGSHTREQGGLGLGLAIVRYIAELHGGSITAKSEGEGLGSTFVVTLPLNVSDAELESAHSLIRELDFGDDSARSQLRGLKILAVDDEPDSLRLVRFLLEKSGAEVRAFENAELAYENLKKWRPDLIISDISMPGESGYEFLHRVRELPSEEGGAVPAFAMTAHAGADDKEKALHAGFQRHFAKPLNTKALLASIKEFSGLL